MSIPIQLFSSSIASNSKKNAQASEPMHECQVCGAAYTRDQCWTCLAREEDVAQEAVFFLFVAAAAWLVLGFATVAAYPPLETNFLTQYPALIGLSLSFIPMFICVPLNLNLAFHRYAIPVRGMLLLTGSALILGAAFFLFNGALDDHTILGIDSCVMRKYTDPPAGSDYPYYNIYVELRWKGKQVQQELLVNKKTFLAVEPGDPVVLAVHPGAFATPWIEDGTWNHLVETVTRSDLRSSELCGR